jgi:hypothetical protein
MHYERAPLHQTGVWCRRVAGRQFPNCLECLGMQMLNTIKVIDPSLAEANKLLRFIVGYCRQCANSDDRGTLIHSSISQEQENQLDVRTCLHELACVFENRSATPTRTKKLTGDPVGTLIAERPLGGRRQSSPPGSHRTQRADFPHWALQKVIHSMAIACSSG